MSHILRREKGAPLYRQLEEILRRQIETGALPEGSYLPTETELQQRFGVSRTTVRQALASLATQGLIVRRQGKGTVVQLRPRIEPRLGRVTSFTEDILESGGQPGAKVLSCQYVKAPVMVAKHLNIKTGGEVIKLFRLRTVNQEPVGLHVAYLNAELLPGLKPEDLAQDDQSLYGLLKRCCGVEIVEADELLEAVKADATTAELLNIAQGDPLLRLVRIGFTAAGEPVEHVHMLYRADKYRYRVRLYR